MLNTATTYLALLQEDDLDIKSIALDKIDILVDDYWAEISDYLKELESLYKEGLLKTVGNEKQELLALILSKIYYNLEDYDSAIDWSLEANTKFNLLDRSQFVQTILKKIIDKYIHLRKNNFFNEQKNEIDERIVRIVDRIFTKCVERKDINQAIGFSLESYDLDRLTYAIEQGSVKEKLKYVYELTQDLIVNKEYKSAVINVILRLYAKHANSQYIDITNCQFLLNNSDALAATLINITKNEQEPLIAFQISFDLVDNQNPAYLKEIVQRIKSIALEQKIEGTANNNVEKLTRILEGNVTRDIDNYVLSKLNRTDPNIMKNLVKAVEKSGSVPHLAVIIANSLMNSHTENDSFLKDNIEWCSKATNWARFTATASLGAIHMGNTKKGAEIMKPYLPGSSNPSIYAQAGGYYGLGLIYANTNDETVLNNLLQALNMPSNSKEAFQHGIFLAIGLVAMASHNQTLYERLRDGMYTDDAITGEAAGYAIGLTMLGSKDAQAIEDLVTYAHDTQHEKIIRAIAMSLALIVYGAEESADTLIEQLSREKDAILRYGAMYCIGLAYAGTGNSNALKKLIKFSVSDVSDDVRRAALINIGFLQIRDPEILLENLKVLSLLSESYNPHVRYGAAMALGISCSGTANISAYNILQPLFSDPSFLVRQGSLIASSLIFSQTTPTQEPKIQNFKDTLDKVINDKDEHLLIRFGGIISQGLMELGGRNCKVNLVSNSGNNRMGSIVGLALFTQYYYWFPMVHFINLAVHPTVFYGIDSNLKVVKNFQILSKAKPSVYGYPKEVKLVEKKVDQKAPTAVLSTHSRAKAKGKKTGTITSILEMQVDEKKEEKKEEEKKEEPEPLEEIINNPARIVPKQIDVIQHISNQDFAPLLKKRLNGYVLLRKTNPNATVAYFDDEIKVPEPQNPDQTLNQTTSYQPIPTQDIEMPEEFDLKDLNNK